MNWEAGMSGLKRNLDESNTQRACKVPCLGFNRKASACLSANGYHCCPTRPNMVENYFNFLKSGLPRRIMYYMKGEWCDFPESVTQALIEGFKGKKSANEVSLGRRPILVDFLSMVLVNLSTRRQRSVAWMDENDRCFFPISFFDDELDDISEFETEGAGKVVPGPVVRTASISQPEVIKSVVVENGAAVPLQTPKPNFLCTKIETLERNSEGFLFAQKLFLSGMGSFAAPQNILHVHRYTPKDVPAKMRLEMFEEQIKVTEELRGNANLQYGWYGAGKREIVSILAHGFGLAGKPTEEGALGTGLYLTPENRAFSSVNLCDDDEKGLQYMILCRAILGNIEQIQQESKQCCPGSHLYDSGADDLSCPKCYIVWSTHMKTYIHPEYVVTYRLAVDVKEYLYGLKDIRFNLVETKLVQDFFTRYPVRRDMYKGPTSPWMSFTLLFSELQDSISTVEKELLYHHYDELKNKIITREELIKKIKVIVGQELLLSTLQRLKHSTSLCHNDSSAQKLDLDLHTAPSEYGESADTAIKPSDNTLPMVPNNPADLSDPISSNESTMSPNGSNDFGASKVESNDSRCCKIGVKLY